MIPLPPGALKHLLETLPPERPDPFPHVADLNPDQLLQRRLKISGQLKILEQGRPFIDVQLLEVSSDPELLFGVRAPGGCVLRSRCRSSWSYATEIRSAIQGLQQQAPWDGRAHPQMGTDLCLVQES